LFFVEGAEVVGFSLDSRSLRRKKSSAPKKKFHSEPGEVPKQAIAKSKTEEVNLCLHALLELLAKKKEDSLEEFLNFIQLSQILLLSVLLLPVLPLEDRYFPFKVEQEAMPLAKMFLFPFFQVLEPLVPSYLPTMTRYYDFIDGRLFHKIFYEQKMKFLGKKSIQASSPLSC